MVTKALGDAIFAKAHALSVGAIVVTDAWGDTVGGTDTGAGATGALGISTTLRATDETGAAYLVIDPPAVRIVRAGGSHVGGEEQGQ